MWTSAIKSIFVPFAPTEKGGTTAAVDVAVFMADRASAHLTLRIAGIKHAAPYGVAPQFTGGLAAQANENEILALQKASEHLSSMMASAGFAHDAAIMQQPYIELVATAGMQGRVHDISVVDAPDEHISLRQSIFEELVFQTGRPVLVVPEGVTAFTCKRIVIAWDGSPRAVRALNDALPFMASAEHIELTTVTNEKKLAGSVPGADMARQLARHGLNVESVEVEMTDDAGAALIDRAELVRADLIVSGAFAHSRWRHLILGGVTTTLLRKTEIPVFMSH